MGRACVYVSLRRVYVPALPKLIFDLQRNFVLHHSTLSYRLINYNRYFHESILAKQEFREVNKPSDGNRQALINYEDTLFNG